MKTTPNALACFTPRQWRFLTCYTLLWLLMFSAAMYGWHNEHQYNAQLRFGIIGFEKGVTPK